MDNSKYITTQVADYVKHNELSEPTTLDKIYNVLAGWSPFYARK